MSTIHENILLLCAERGITAGKMCGDLGLSRSLISDLKAGRKQGVTDKTAIKIAQYFNVPVGRVLGTDTKNSPADNGEGMELTQKQKDLASVIPVLPDQIVSILLSAAEDYLSNQQSQDVPK